MQVEVTHIDGPVASVTGVQQFSVLVAVAGGMSGAQGGGGSDLPSGGAIGQVLAKTGFEDYAIGWVNLDMESGGVVPWTSVTDKPSFAPVAFSGAYGDLTGRPTSFVPAAHGHAVADVSGLQTTLSGLSASIAAIQLTPGPQGNSAVITVVTTQAAFDAATPGPLEFVVLYA